jgi:hypothetical protein
MSSGILSDVIHLAVDYVTGNYAGMIQDVMGLIKDIMKEEMGNAMQQAGASQGQMDAANQAYDQASGGSTGSAQGKQDLMNSACQSNDFASALRGLIDAIQQLVQEIMREAAGQSNGKGHKGGSGGTAAGSGQVAGNGGGAAGAGGVAMSPGDPGGATGADPAGGAASGAGDGGDDFFIAMAKALGQAAQSQANKVENLSKQLSQAVNIANAANSAAGSNNQGQMNTTAATENAKNNLMALQTQLMGESQKMGFMMQAINTALNAVGEALKTAARMNG